MLRGSTIQVRVTAREEDTFIVVGFIQRFTRLPCSKIKSENENFKDRKKTKITGINKSRFLDRNFVI